MKTEQMKAIQKEILQGGSSNEDDSLATSG